MLDGKLQHRTPWAKMKGIKNSFKKRHRLSAQSDDTHFDEPIIYSENEDVFEDNTWQNQARDNAATSAEIPAEIIERYKQASAEDKKAESDKTGMRKVSRWTRVKKAFLAPPNELVIAQQENQMDNPDSVSKIQEEIHRNYRQLQQQLSQEFQAKMQEWEKMKAIPSTSSASPTSIEEHHDPAFLKKMEEWEKIKSNPQQRPALQLQSEENLPPEFRKKLQEWQKIKKTSCKNYQRKQPHFEYPQLSEDFLKKLEEWKHIKANGGASYTEDSESRKSKEDKTPSPKMIRKPSPLKYKKVKDPAEKELQWFEKELGKIEKEKQRLERERQKFLEREERLTKLRRSIMGGNKKEVLVHTRSGFHRFEGISRKFTQKLYEWEKAQGIAPEESTFALLTSSYAPQIRSPVSSTKTSTPPLVRSKSADSIAPASLNLNCPIISHQPSSLSLNDMEDLEKECLTESKSSSVQFLEHLEQLEDNLEEQIENDEPEALIVEVEDIVEETAAPLAVFLDKKQTPVYQQECIKSFCAGEAVVAPKIRRSESKRAQTNYNLIEEVMSIVKQMIENDKEIVKLDKKDIQMKCNLEEFYNNQKSYATKLAQKLVNLQAANAKVVADIRREAEPTNNYVEEIIETILDLSADLCTTVDKFHIELSQYITEAHTEKENCTNTSVLEQISRKVLELRRLLSCLCGSSDGTTPGKKSVKSEKQAHSKAYTNSSENEAVRYVKCDNPSQGAIKKKIRHRQKNYQSKQTDDSEEDEYNNIQKAQHKKLTRTKSVGTNISKPKEEECRDEDNVVVDPELAQKVVVETETNFVTSTEAPTIPDSPVTVFVKTTRKLFTPIVESKLSEEDSKPKRQEEQHNSRLPPLPSSPIPQRKMSKEISPNIRIMLQRYNQKISEQETSGVKSAGSSGSNSPIAWRSPVSERRIKVQMEKYQEEVRKLSPLCRKKEVQKSASMGVLSLRNKQVTTPQRGEISNENQLPTGTVVKSSSTSKLPINQDNANHRRLEKKPSSLKLTIAKATPTNLSPEIRSRRLQQAKEEFLRSGCASAPVTATQNDPDRLKYPARNRLSQISVGSESSCDSAACCEGMLIKSASAGMINIDADTYRKIDPEVHREGYVSLPRNCKKHKEGFLSNIASKFRKIKMRRGKERDQKKMNVVSALCRHSLVVDINETGSEKEPASRQNSNKE